MHRSVSSPLIALTVAAAAALVWSLLSQSAPAQFVGRPSTISGCGTGKPIHATPFTIDKPGAWFLATNLSGPGSGLDAITITVSDVELDLRGALLSDDGSSGHGIATGPATRNITIRGGSIRGFGGSGIDAANTDGLRVIEVSASDCQQAGINAGSSSFLSQCTTDGNGAGGIISGTRSRHLDCAAAHNGSTGMVAGLESSFVRCATFSNAAGGFIAAGGSRFDSCSAILNTGTGFNSAGGTLVQDCIARRNTAIGVSPGNGGLIVDCVTSGNLMGGMRAGPDGMVRGSVSWGNSVYGIQLNGTGFATGNLCNADGLTSTGLDVNGDRNVVDSNQLIENSDGLDLSDASSSFFARTFVTGSSPGADYDLGTDNIGPPPVSAAVPTAPWGNGLD